MAVMMFSQRVLATLFVSVLCAGAAFAGEDLSLRTIPIDDTPVSTAAPVEDNSTEDNTRAFNTPTDDGRPGEYFFVLGVQAAKKGDYRHAMDMYKISAYWAYKPAEYNLGVMYLSGQGTEVDLPQALAWMALAAERNDAPYVRARQLVYAHLTPAQYEQANVIWRGLLPKYGDESALPRAKAQWHEALVNATGSRVGSSAAHVMVGGADGSPNHMAKANLDVHSGGHISQNPGEVTGVHQADGAIAYQALHTTTNPYDPRVMPVSGTATVGSLTQVKDKDAEATKQQPADKDSGDTTHP
ncbi:sel1 repeat family protein [Dyella sp. C11]|uniref:tetratricopeptide repeat protein n=1 Tax=Dyella sp. C11 TaxID=2126991 RepID=UPI000D65D5B0|nr:sel1 repeat family protein [Dyella sp. C11]